MGTSDTNVRKSYLIVTSNADALPVMAIADAMRRVGHEVSVRHDDHLGPFTSKVDAVIFAECTRDDVVIALASQAFASNHLVGAVGNAVGVIVGAGLARGRVVSAPGRGDALLEGGAQRSDTEVSGDDAFVTASGPHCIDDLVLMIRQRTEIAVPQDAETLTAVLKDLADAGYAGSVTVDHDGTITCMECAQSCDAGDVRVDELRRLEGASDPDDELAVIAGRCPHCGSRLSFVLGYGPGASSGDTTALLSLSAVEGSAQQAQQLSPSTKDGDAARGQ